MNKPAFKEAVEDILGVSRGSLKDSDSRDTISSWSSLVDVKLVTFISSELNVQVGSEIMEAETFADLVRELEAQGALSD